MRTLPVLAYISYNNCIITGQYILKMLLFDLVIRLVSRMACYLRHLRGHSINHKSEPFMISSFILIAIRNIRRHFSYALLNISGTNPWHSHQHHYLSGSSK